MNRDIACPVMTFVPAPCSALWPVPCLAAIRTNRVNTTRALRFIPFGMSALGASEGQNESAAGPKRNSTSFTIRPAKPSDMLWARWSLLNEKMNPIIFSERDFIVAETDTIQSMPNQLAGFVQIRPIGNEHHELASLFVAPEYRGLGLGKALVRHRIQEFFIDPINNDKPLFLLCLEESRGFYEKLGFAVVSDPGGKSDTAAQPSDTAPFSLQAERYLGTYVSRLFANGQQVHIMKYMSD